MGFDRYSRAHVQDDTTMADRGGGRTIVLALSGDGQSMTFEHRTAGGSTLAGKLARSNWERKGLPPQ
jgi:hypothetical protein